MEPCVLSARSGRPSEDTFQQIWSALVVVPSSRGNATGRRTLRTPQGKVQRFDHRLPGLRLSERCRSLGVNVALCIIVFMDGDLASLGLACALDSLSFQVHAVRNVRPAEQQISFTFRLPLQCMHMPQANLHASRTMTYTDMPMAMPSTAIKIDDERTHPACYNKCSLQSSATSLPSACIGNPITVK